MEDQKVIYLCGPHEESANNYHAFKRCQEQIEAKGFKVLNPHDFFDKIDTSKLTLNDILKMMVAKMMEADTLVTMPAWETNMDATHIVKIARLVGIDIEPYVAFFDKYEIKIDVAA